MGELRIDDDSDTIDNRRIMRAIAEDGFVYDTETASLLHRYEVIKCAGKYFHGEALYVTRNDQLFLHYYHQWDRFNYLVPLTIPDAIKWLVKYNPKMIEGYFGYLPEKGEGEPFTPIKMMK